MAVQQQDFDQRASDFGFAVGFAGGSSPGVVDRRERAGGAGLLECGRTSQRRVAQ